MESGKQEVAIIDEIRRDAIGRASILSAGRLPDGGKIPGFLGNRGRGRGRNCQERSKTDSTQSDDPPTFSDQYLNNSNYARGP